MQQVCKALTFPDKVAAAALLFFKRFYLTFSSLDHDPKNIMLTCIYLACKVVQHALTPVNNMTCSVMSAIYSVMAHSHSQRYFVLGVA